MKDKLNFVIYICIYILENKLDGIIDRYILKINVH